MRYYAFNLDASTTKAFNLKVQGSYIRYRKVLTGVDAPEILIETNRGDLIPLLPGEDAYLGDTCEEFKVFNVLGTSAMTGVLLIGGGADAVKFSSDRIAGEVSIIDGGKAVTLSSRAFRHWQVCAASVGKYSHCQLWNPSGSGKNLVVQKILISISSAAVVYVGAKSTALATAGTAPYSKLLGDATASVGLGKKETNAAQQFTTQRSIYTGAAGLYLVEAGPEPDVIPPGQGLTFTQSLTNADLAITIDYKEESI